jgi:hypothetical protein
MGVSRECGIEGLCTLKAHTVDLRSRLSDGRDIDDALHAGIARSMEVCERWT